MIMIPGMVAVGTPVCGPPVALIATTVVLKVWPRLALPLRLATISRRLVSTPVKPSESVNSKVPSSDG